MPKPFDVLVAAERVKQIVTLNERYPLLKMMLERHPLNEHSFVAPRRNMPLCGCPYPGTCGNVACPHRIEVTT